MNHHLKLSFAALVALVPACSSAPVDEPIGLSSNKLSHEEHEEARSESVENSPSGKIKHVIFVEFDNTHLSRDNKNVPSDLEQMPNLLNFLKGDGTVINHHHTPLISHTADDIITSLTGVYPDHHGIAVANSYGFFLQPPTATHFDGFTSAFSYWTNIVNPTKDLSFNLVTKDGKNAPAPWVAWTRAGFDVGAVSVANMELENVSSDINNIFGPSSPEAAEAAANFDKAVADFEGIAVHCAAGSTVCAASNGGRPDVLPQEPGGYTRFSALYGHAKVAPVISPTGPLTDLDGALVTDGNGNNGFPGFGGISASQTLSYIASMQEHGIAVTYGYISDAHGNHVTDAAFGPGEAGYVAQLKAYDSAFGKFFARLAADGITKNNTLFVFTSDEGDHFAGGAPTPSNCDGVTVPCSYPKIGEVDANLKSLLNQQDPTLAATPFDIHFDMAPTFYISGNPAPGAPIARAYERAASQLTAVSPITGNVDHLTEFLADPVEMKMLHMVTGDPQRTPSFVMFGNPDYFFLTFGSPDLVEDPTFAWNHGGTNPEIVTTWLGIVGPGVKHRGIDDDTWSDHTDIRPTMLLLAGLTDDYAHDGRVLAETLHENALPKGIRDDGGEVFTALARAYKQLNAPVGKLGRESLEASTRALAGDDVTYAKLEDELAELTVKRDALAAKMIAALEDAAFKGKRIDSESAFDMVHQAEELIETVTHLTRN